MYKFPEIVDRQKDFVQSLRELSNSFADSIDKDQIETILLSGSVSRGDYYYEPSAKYGMIDLIVMKKEGSKITAEEIFGANITPNIPFHGARFNTERFQILFIDFITLDRFKEFNEPRKFSVMESKVLYDPNSFYENELIKIKKYVEDELKNKLVSTLGYLKYIIAK